MEKSPPMRSIRHWMSFVMVVFRCHGDAGAVHKDDLPGACLFFQEGRFQPFLVGGAGRVSDAAFIGIRDPSGVTANVNVRFGHVPFITFACGVLGFDENHDGVAVESCASIKYVKVRYNHRVELRNIVCARCNEYRTHCVYDLPLVGSEGFLLGFRNRDTYCADECEDNDSQRDAGLWRHGISLLFGRCDRHVSALFIPWAPTFPALEVYSMGIKK